MKKLINLSDNLVHYNGDTPTENLLASRLCKRVLLSVYLEQLRDCPIFFMCFFYAKQKFIK